MKIKQILLDENNPISNNGSSIGSDIQNHHQKHLWSERKSKNIDVVVIHYISAINIHPRMPFLLSAILKIFVDYGLSSHYLISRHGTVYLLVPEEKKAWHCGFSKMPYPDEREMVNDFSIGIELMGAHTRSFTKAQYRALSKLCYDIEMRYNKKFIYVGHDQIAGTEAVAAKLRSEPKIDPGPLFRWPVFLELLDNLRQVHENHKNC